MIVQSSLSNRKQQIFNSSLKIAEKSDIMFQHGCVATCGGKIIARGYNTYKNYTKRDNFLKNTCTCHAEVNVLRQIYHRSKKRNNDRKMRRVVLYISRAGTKDNHVNNSAPCHRCMEVINKLNVKQIIFYLDKEFYIMKPHEYTRKHYTFGEAYLERSQ